MGYYTGSGVVVSRSATPVCHAVEMVPSYYLDGVPAAFRRVVYTGVQTETVTRFAGVADPGAEGLSGASVTMSPTNPPHEASFVGWTASRIGSSNLFEKVKTERTTTG